MAIIKTLKNLFNNHIVHPVTTTKAVFDNRYGWLSNILESYNNDNLLLNSNFTVCQRNTSGSFVFNNEQSGSYLFDRWRFCGESDAFITSELGRGLTYSLSADTDGASVNYMEQPIDESVWKLMGDKRVTLSSKITTNGHTTAKLFMKYIDKYMAIHNTTKDLSDVLIEGEPTTVSMTFRVPNMSDVKTLIVGIILMETGSDNVIPSGSNTNVEYVKLEVGVVATPNAALTHTVDELELCKKYYQVVNIGDLRASSISDNSITAQYGPLVNMRCSGVCECVSGSLYTFEIASGEVVDADLIVDHDNNNGYGQLTLTANKTSHGLTDGVFRNVTVTIDCEL